MNAEIWFQPARFWLTSRMADRKRESNQSSDLASNGGDLYVTVRRRGCHGNGDAIDSLRMGITVVGRWDRAHGIFGDV